VIAPFLAQAAAAAAAPTAQAAGTAPTAIGQPNNVAMAFFFFFIAITLGITWWAARKTRTTEQFYAAGRTVSAGQNGFALAGDYMSAASFLGIAGLVSTTGFDGRIYSTGWLVGWPVVLFLVAEPLRNLGKYTFADVVATRLSQTPVRLAAAVGTLSTVIFYLIAQMVGAGSLIKLMFGLSYETAVMIVGAAMIAYVIFGGMLATTWVQIVKAALLLGGAASLAFLVLLKFGMNPLALFAAANAKYGAGVLAPGKLVSNPLDTISLGMALMFGTAGLPHILMRFYTVPNAKAARKSVFYATGLIGFFYLLTFILGFGAMVLVGPDAIKAVDKGGNMAAPLLAEYLGGTPFLGFIAAVAFATILAVVAGLTLSGAAALSHDLWTSVVRKGHARVGEELKVARGAALVLSIFWRRCTTQGAVASMVAGTVGTLVLIWLSPVIQVDILKHTSSWFPLKNPAVLTIPGSFLIGILVSLFTSDEQAVAGYDGSLRDMIDGARAA
jgi:cation/acetate symporter